MWSEKLILLVDFILLIKKLNVKSAGFNNENEIAPPKQGPEVFVIRKSKIQN